MIHSSRLVLIVLVVLLLAPALAAAQVRYKDDEGIWHFVNSIDEVPEKYRKGAVGRQPSAPANQFGKPLPAGCVFVK